MGYRPLPDCLTIKNSTIEGLGLFSKSFIKKNTDLGVTHYRTQDYGIIRTPLGGFINHSNDPNCFLKERITFLEDYHGSPSLNEYCLVTLRNIEEGDEITLKYQHFNSYRQ